MSAGRLRSLDVFRGLTIAGMVLVNSPGLDAAYAPLRHSHWDGCSAADLVFPFFLFIMGTAMAFASSRNVPGAPVGPVLRRAAVLSAVILLGYWAALALVPVPGFGAGVTTPEGSLPSYVDRLVFGRHTYFGGPFDPEGLLSTAPAVVTVLLGSFAGAWLRGGRTPEEKSAGLAAAGIVGVALGMLWALWFPLNKALWTSSFVVYTAGWAALGLGACYYALDVRGAAVWAGPFEALGANAIAAYVLHLLLLKALVYTKLGGVSLRLLVCGTLFGGWLPAKAASLAFALAHAALWAAALTPLHRRGLFLKA